MVAIVVAAWVVVSGAGIQYFSGGVAGVPLAQAQDDKAPEPKGVTSRGLVGSTGPIASVNVTVPVALSGQVVELAPGGQTGRQRNLAPSFLYVLQGTLVIDTTGGPIGVSGVQYHGEGQGYAAPANLWYNVTNTGQKPAKYLLLFVAPPGGKTLEPFKAED
jgi:quercetin dioxygenase-like cupin family protein